MAHLEETKGQVTRLRTISEHLGKTPTGKHCDGTEGGLKEVEEAVEEDSEGALKNAGIRNFGGYLLLLQMPDLHDCCCPRQPTGTQIGFRTEFSTALFVCSSPCSSI